MKLLLRFVAVEKRLLECAAEVIKAKDN